MRSHSSHSHSSMHHSSSLHSRSTVHRSIHHTSSNFNRMHHSSIKHSSLTHNGLKHSSSARDNRNRLLRNSMRKHGISDAHAFSVGKATGVNINASAAGAHGAALHRSRKIRQNSSNMHKHYTRKNSTMRKIGLSRSKGHRYTSKTNFDDVEPYINDLQKEIQKFTWIPFIMIFGMVIFFMIIMITVVSKF